MFHKSGDFHNFIRTPIPHLENPPVGGQWIERAESTFIPFIGKEILNLKKLSKSYSIEKNYLYTEKHLRQSKNCGNKKTNYVYFYLYFAVCQSYRNILRKFEDHFDRFIFAILHWQDFGKDPSLTFHCW